ncbi:MAG: PAS domain S-box protein [Anaerolineales bacterium]|nr:PAS domain S-box protein [Anaerolineales bacterium]
MITTGKFTKGMEQAAFERGAAPITLIDGERLLDLLIEYEIGVSKRQLSMWNSHQCIFTQSEPSNTSIDVGITTHRATRPRHYLLLWTSYSALRRIYGHSHYRKRPKFSRIGSWEWDLASGIGTCSPGFFCVYGLDNAVTVTLCDWMALGLPEDRPAIQKVFDDAIAGIAPFAGEHRIIRHNDGAVRYVRVWGRVVRDADGSAITLIGATQDVTESNQSEWRHAQLAAIVANADVSIIGTDLDTRVMSWNHGAEQLYGYTSAEAIGRPLAVLIAPDEAAQLAHNTELIRKDTVVANFRGKRRTKDDRIIDVVATISPVRDVLGNIIGASAIAHDITPISELERSLEVNLTKYVTLFELALDQRH